MVPTTAASRRRRPRRVTGPTGSALQGADNDRTEQDDRFYQERWKTRWLAATGAFDSPAARRCWYQPALPGAAIRMIDFGFAGSCRHRDQQHQHCSVDRMAAAARRVPSRHSRKEANGAWNVMWHERKSQLNRPLDFQDRAPRRKTPRRGTIRRPEQHLDAILPRRRRDSRRQRSSHQTEELRHDSAVGAPRRDRHAGL